MRLKTKSFRKRWDRLRGKAPWWFLKDAKGVIHIGANSGQERDIYAARDLNVLWVEPIPDVFAQLEKNISGYSKQTAIEALASDVSGREMTLNISNNEGQSSSVLPLSKHTEIWPSVHFVSQIHLVSETLPEIIERSGIALESFDTLVMDTQGSELPILKGASDILSRFRFIQAEAATIPIYEGYPLLDEMDNFMASNGFRQAHKWRFADHRNGGACYDVTYKNTSAVR